MPNRLLAVVALSTATAATLTGCGSSSSGGTTPRAGGTAGASASDSAACSPQNLKTRTPGTLTIGADNPVYPPWFSNNQPGNGKGFEGAVDAAIAKQLGYSPSQVKIARTTFNAAIKPGPKGFDLMLDEFSITPARQRFVDFSAPYYDVTQAIVAVKGSKSVGVTSVAGLKSLKLGAQIGTTSYTAITDQIKPSQTAAGFQTNAAALLALKNGQIDGLVTDLPTAFYMVGAQLKDGQIVGQLPNAGGKPEQFGALLDKGSPLTSCVSQAVDALRTDGTLDAIQKKWLAQAGGAPVLQ